MSSFYADYMKELEDVIVVEQPYGFWSYRVNGSLMYVKDIYIRPANRDDHATVWDMLNDIVVTASQQDCTHLMGTVNPKAHNADASIKVLHAAGFKVSGCDTHLIYFTRPTIMEGEP